MNSRDVHTWMWGEALSLLEQAERRQKEFFRPAANARGWEPPVDVIEHSGTLFVRVALPGVSADAITVVLDTDAVTVSALRPFDETARGALLHRVEIPYGRFVRRIRLPVHRLEPAGRSFIDGCLTLAFRKLAVNEV